MENSANPFEIVSDEELEHAARQLVEFFRAPLQGLAPDQDPKPVFALMLRAFEDPEALIREIVAEARKTSPDQQRADVKVILEMMRSPRKALELIVKDVVPKGVRGKKPKITEIRERQMVGFARALFSAARALVELREAFPKRTVAESLDYLEKDYPLPAAKFRQHTGIITAFFHQIGKLPKSSNTRTRRLVCEIVANEFEISVAYAERWLGPAA